jgi:hypothetical protein
MLMAIRKLRIDVFAAAQQLLETKVKFVVPNTVIRELNRLQDQPGEKGRAARYALERAKDCEVIDANSAEGSVDDSILRAAVDNSAIVATADTELRKKLRNAKIPVIFVRGKSKLMIEGPEAAYY